MKKLWKNLFRMKNKQPHNQKKTRVSCFFRVPGFTYNINHEMQAP